ncbi:Crp/Fnr family transcriptional regulator [Flagellimonas sp.]|uniref:Crp/Fnr family transcriptional regulator n=1 Tax=Flagellimonas sp. TaxID=2058762 RepID=UPI003F49DCA2
MQRYTFNALINTIPNSVSRLTLSHVSEENDIFQFLNVIQQHATLLHPLLQHINRQIALNEVDFNVFLDIFQTENYAKNHLLIHPNQKVEHQYFVLNGCLRTYLIDSSGKEHTMQFAVENWWVSDYLAYYKGGLSIFYVECLEACQLMKVRKQDLEEMFLSLPIIESYFRLQLENAFAAFQKRILSSLNLTAQERYSQFIQIYPDIEQRVKNYQIASYLGITPESLSRLRKNAF